MFQHSKSEERHSREIIEAGKKLYALGYVAATDGNISVRLDPGRILTTPTGMSKGFMETQDLVIVSPDGRKISGSRDPSSELAMHLLVYNNRPGINAVVHAHPPVATGYAAAGISLNKALISEVVLSLGCIPLAPYGTPGTAEVTKSLAEFIKLHDAVLMANHGAVTFASDLEKALWKMETVEHFAKISLVTEVLGKQSILSESAVDKLFQARTRYFGPQSPGGVRTPACPVASPDPKGRECFASSKLDEAELKLVIETIIKEILKCN